MTNPFRTMSQDEITKYMPTAVGTGAWEVWVLAMLYVLTALLALAELARSNRLAFRFLSFRSAFLILSFLQMVIKGVFYLVPFGTYVTVLFIFFYLELTVYIQFVTFSLLVIFFAKCLLYVQGREEMVRKRLYPIYGVFLGLIMVGCLVASFIIAAQLKPDNKHLRDFDRKSSMYTGLIYLFLVTLTAIYGYKIYRILSSVALSETKRQKVHIFVGMTIMYFVLFVARVLWDITYYFNWNPVMNDLIRGDVDARTYYLVMLLFYGITEVVPTLSIVAAFRIFLETPTKDDDASGESQPLAADAPVNYAYGSGHRSLDRNV